MTKLNVPLLRKVVEWAEEQEKLDIGTIDRKWMQSHWFIDYAEVTEHQLENLDVLEQRINCGTAYCLAGYIAIDLEGWKPIAVHEGVTSDCQHPETKQISTIPRVALLALGLTDENDDKTYDELFEPGNNAARIRELAEAYAGERL